MATCSNYSCKYTIVVRGSNIIFSSLEKQWCTEKYFELVACLKGNPYQDLITTNLDNFSSLSPFSSISYVSNFVCITYFVLLSVKNNVEISGYIIEVLERQYTSRQPKYNKSYYHETCLRKSTLCSDRSASIDGLKTSLRKLKQLHKAFLYVIICKALFTIIDYLHL